jgi:hypothetical protein
MAKSDPKLKIEVEPDAWERFERAVKVVAKSPPQHRGKVKTKTSKSPTRKRVVKKSPKNETP